MNKVDALCGMDRAMMYEFSRQSVERLRNGLRFRLIMPLFSDLMDANVDKEVEKDVLIIKSAARAFGSGVDGESMNIAELFRETTEVDRRFMEKLLRLPPVSICYECIEDIRKKRIQLLVSTVYEILSQWLDSIPFRAAVKRAYSQQDFEALLNKMLHLYTLETRELSNSLNLPLARELFTNTVFNTMEIVADSVAAAFGRKVFEGGEDLCQDRP
jgi:hypothetical protein